MERFFLRERLLPIETGSQDLSAEVVSAASQGCPKYVSLSLTLDSSVDRFSWVTIESLGRQSLTIVFF